jgi:hypothetical protein
MARLCGPGGGDDDDGGGAGWRWRRRRRSGMMMMTTEEERDNAVPGHGCEGRADGGNDVDPTVVTATAWRRTGWR